MGNDDKASPSVECSTDHRLRLPARKGSLGEIRDFCKSVFYSYPIDEQPFRQLILAIDEAAANVVEHAFPAEEKGEIALRISVQPDHVLVELRDRGVCFDPLKVIPVNRSASFSRRGYGLPLIRRIMDEICYERSAEGENVLTLTKRIDKR